MAGVAELTDHGPPDKEKISKRSGDLGAPNKTTSTTNREPLSFVNVEYPGGKEKEIALRPGLTSGGVASGGMASGGVASVGVASGGVASGGLTSGGVASGDVASGSDRQASANGTGNIRRLDDHTESSYRGSDPICMERFSGGLPTMISPVSLIQSLSSGVTRPVMAQVPTDKDSMIKVLIQDVRLLQGKVKGYETLAELFQQSKQECSRVKQDNELLRQQQLHQQQQLPSKSHSSHDSRVSSSESRPTAADSQLVAAASSNSAATAAAYAPGTNTNTAASTNVATAETAAISASATGNTTATTAAGNTTAAAAAGNTTAAAAAIATASVPSMTSASVAGTVVGMSTVSDDDRDNQMKEDATSYSIISTASDADNIRDGGRSTEGGNIENGGKRDPRETELVRPRFPPDTTVGSASPGGRGISDSLDLREVEVTGGRTSGGKAGVLSPGSTSSASFVRITSSDRETFSRENSDLEDVRLMAFDDLNIVRDRGTVERGARLDVSLTDSDQSSHLSADLKRVTIKAMKLEKHCREKQVVIDRLTEENAVLKKRMNSLIDNLDLLNSYAIVDKARPATASPSPAAGAVADQVAVGGASSSAAGQLIDEQLVRAGSEEISSSPIGDQYMSIMTAEMIDDLISRRDTDKLVKKILELQVACTKLSDAFKQQLMIGEDKDCELQRYSENQSESNQRQQDLLLELLHRKSALEEETERGKERELDMKRVMERNKQLEAEIYVLTQRQIEAVNGQVRENEEAAVEYRESSTGHRGRLDSLTNQILLLKQQLRVFKEDFDQERRDRGLAKAEADNYRRQLTERTEENLSLKHTLEKRDSELIHTSKKNKKLEAYCSKLSKDLQDYIRHYTETTSSSGASSRAVRHIKNPGHRVRSEELTCSTTRSTLGQLPGQHRATANTASDNWACSCCTYLNTENRQKCEICNTLRSPLGSQSQRECTFIPDLSMYEHDSCDSSWLMSQQQQQQQPYMELISRSDSSDRKKIDRSVSGDVTID